MTNRSSVLLLEFELLSNLGIKNVIELSQTNIKIPMVAILVKEKVLAHTKSLIACLNSMNLAELNKSKKVFMGLLDEKE